MKLLVATCIVFLSSSAFADLPGTTSNTDPGHESVHSKPDQKESMDAPQKRADKALKRKGHGPKSPEKMTTDKSEDTQEKR
jgi:hypothetical protein